jgi:phosphoserine phosphatase
MIKGFENILKQENLTGKEVVFDLDGTLLSGDLGETVFFFMIILQSMGIEDENEFSSAISKIKAIKELSCLENDQLAEILKTYLYLMKEQRYIEAYQLTAKFLAKSDTEKIYSLVRVVLDQGVHCNKIKYLLGEESFEIILHSVEDNLMSSFIRTCTQSGANILIVSGSPQTIVEGYCLYQSLPISIARGVVLQKDGQYFVPYGQSKMSVIKAAGFKNPYLAFGNSIGDFEMLASAKHSFIRKSDQRIIQEKVTECSWYFF